MSLKIKFSILLSAIFIGLLLAIILIFSFVIYPAFEELEYREAEKNINRVLDILASDIKDMDSFAYDWATWDDTYNFIKDRNQHYIDSNYLPKYSLAQNHDLYYIWDISGKPVLNKALNKEGNAYTTFNEFPEAGLPKNHPLALDTLNSKMHGLIQTDQGAMIVAARPIITSKLKGPIRGVLLMGRYLDEEIIENITKRSRLDLDIWPIDKGKPIDMPKDVPRNLSPGDKKIAFTEDKKTVFAYSSYADIFGDPAILIRISMSRNIVNQGKSTIAYGIGMVLISGLMLMGILLFILQRSIVSPLTNLARNIMRLGKSEGALDELPVDRSDELGIVARSIHSSNEERNIIDSKLVIQNEILGSVAKKINLKLILDNLIIQLETLLPKSICSILITDEEGKYLRHFSSPSLPKSYIEKINKVEIGSSIGSCGAAAYHNKIVISEDIATDPKWSVFKDIALPYGLKTCWSFPINNSSGKVLGTFAFYYKETSRFTDNDEKLIQPFAFLAGIAIESRNVDQELVESKNAAEKASHAKSIFLANMSHEIRTPMNAVLGYSQILMRNKDLDQKTKDIIRTVHDNGDNLLKLINEVLDLSKIEAGKMKLNLIDFDLNHLIEEIDNLFELRCNLKKLRWTVKGFSEPVYVKGDETKLRQVLVNLLANAIKFTDFGEIMLTVAQLENQQYRFNVIDTGYGISDEVQEKVFGAFEQDDVGGKRGGTGLGLAIAKKQLQFMGSDLFVKSKIHEGSDFYFTLRLPPSMKGIKKSGMKSDLVLRLAPEYKIKALVVDDVKENRELLSLFLSEIGVKTIEADNGEEAVEKVIEHSPDIVFMDLRMPIMRGEEALNLIQKSFGKDQIKVVAITASVIDRKREYFLNLGFHEYISKPFKAEEIFDCLSQLLGVKFVSEEDNFLKDELPNLEELDFSKIFISEDSYRKLERATKLNNITEIENVCKELGKINGDSKKLADHLESLLNRYEIKGILDILEKLSINR